MTDYFDSKDPTEKIVLTFDMTLGLATGETLTGAPVVSIFTASGTDPTPTAVLTGANALDATSKKVLVGVQAGVLGCAYDVKVVVSTSNAQKVLALSGILPVVGD